MKKIISYPFTVIFYLLFGILIVVFHPIQWICFNFFGYQAHKKSVDILNFFLLTIAHVLGASYKVSHTDRVPKNAPVIFVSNHQSMYDVAMIIWFLRRAHPKFVSKKELGEKIPSISYNLKHGGSVLIDRKDPKQALPAIKGLAEYIQKHHRAAVIFPEGTRSKTGKPKFFSENGLKILCKFAPDAYVVPLTINNSWKLFRFGMFPLGLFANLALYVHKPIKISDYDFKRLLELTEEKVISKIKY